MTKSVPMMCPHCGSEEVIKSGTSANGTQRYRCKNTACSKTTFLQKYGYKGCMKRVKEKIVGMAINGSGVRDTSRVLQVSKNTVIDTLKKTNPRGRSEPKLPNRLIKSGTNGSIGAGVP